MYLCLTVLIKSAIASIYNFMKVSLIYGFSLVAVRHNSFFCSHQVQNYEIQLIKSIMQSKAKEKEIMLYLI